MSKVLAMKRILAVLMVVVIAVMVLPGVAIASESPDIDPVVDKTEYKLVTLKFFIFPGMEDKFTCDYIDEIVKQVNDIYRCQCKKDLRFVWHKCHRTVLPVQWQYHDLYSNAELLRLVRNMEDCSHGINVIFVPMDYCDGNWNGRAYFRWCSGVTGAATGGIKIRDTCDKAQMARTLAHELLHALGLSHEAQRYTPQPPVPPHGRRVPGGWDFDCNGKVDPADTAKLLWGNKLGGTVINPDQCDYIWERAEKIPCTKKKKYCQPTLEIWPSGSAFAMDPESDVPPEFGYIDMVGSLAIVYFDPAENRCSFSLEVPDIIPHDRPLRYGFYLNTDDDINTGSLDGILQGADFAAILNIFPPVVTAEVNTEPFVTEAKLWKYDEGWVEFQILDWEMGEVAADVIGDDFGYEEYVGHVVNIEVPLESLDLTFEGAMQIRSFAEDARGVEETVIDLCPVMSLPLEIVPPPLINLDPTSGCAGEAITVYGSSFTPNASVSIEFDGVEVANVNTDYEGSFSVTITVPSVPCGFYPVRAADSDCKHDHSMLCVKDCEPPKNAEDYPRYEVGEQNPDGTYQVTITDVLFDDISGVKRVAAEVDGIVEFEADDINMPEYEFSFVANLVPGEHTLSIEAWDVAGNYLQKEAAVIVPVQATINIDPDTLNLRSKSKWVTAYIELIEGYDVEGIDISTVMLNGIVPALAHPTEVGDYDSDAVPDLMVKFDRSAVQEVLEPGDEVEVTVSGELIDGTPFEGADTIRVIDKY